MLISIAGPIGPGAPGLHSNTVAFSDGKPVHPAFARTDIFLQNALSPTLAKNYQQRVGIVRPKWDQTIERVEENRHSGRPRDALFQWRPCVDAAFRRRRRCHRDAASRARAPAG